MRDKFFSLGLGVSPGEFARAPPTCDWCPWGTTTLSEAVYHPSRDLFKVGIWLTLIVN